MRRSLKRLVYRSEALIEPDDPVALDAIFRTSLAHNRRDRITGALVLADGKFVQVLEGAEAGIDALMVRICADHRHRRPVVLGQWPVTARLFAGWAMARPDPRPLSLHAFDVVTGDGSGVQVTDVLLGLLRNAEASWF